MAETGRPRATQYAARHIAALGQLIPVQGNRVQITIANQTSMRQCREEGSERCEWLWKEFDDGESLRGEGHTALGWNPSFPSTTWRLSVRLSEKLRFSLTKVLETHFLNNKKGIILLI